MVSEVGSPLKRQNQFRTAPSSLPKINGTADLLRLYPECFRGVGKFEGDLPHHH